MVKDCTSYIHHLKDKSDEKVKPVASPICPAVGYSFPNLKSAIETVSGNEERIYYGRYGNPTTLSLQMKIAHMEQAEAAIGVSSGMAAISSSLLYFLNSGDHIICTKDIYGGTYHFIENQLSRFNIETSYIDCTSLEKVSEAFKDNTKVLYLETPSNPTLTVIDIKKVVLLAHEKNVKVIVDNTFCTPYLQKPLTLGADVVVHSATKYLNGHGDVIAGFIVGDKQVIKQMNKTVVGDFGQVQNPWDAYLIDRGLKTLGVRMDKHCQNALEIAAFLEEHPKIKRVYYPGLSSHPQHIVAKDQMKHFGGIISFELKEEIKHIHKFINTLRMILLSFSLGDPETLIQHPASMTHFSLSKEDRKKAGITDGLIRLSIGLEDLSDIKEDLEQALSKC